MLIWKFYLKENVYEIALEKKNHKMFTIVEEPFTNLQTSF